MGKEADDAGHKTAGNAAAVTRNLSLDLNGLLSAGEEAGVPFSVAGGVNVATINAVQRAGADVAVVGGGIYSAADPAQAAKELRAAII
jgi:3-hexulose-6-phosphate synthase